MASESHHNQDLASILSVLAAYGPAIPEQDTITNRNATAEGRNASTSDHQTCYIRGSRSGLQTFVNNDENDEIYEPPEPSIVASRFVLDIPHTSKPSRQLQPGQHLPSSASRITEWSAGLRHITQLAALNPNLDKSIKKLIHNQRQNEQDWWAARETLLSKQKDRVQEKATLNELLRSVGGQVTSSEGPDPDTELAQFDIKVHRAQVKMFRVMQHELMTLGVPFFGTDDVLVVDDKHRANCSKGNTDDTKLISNLELLRLQRKMLIYLEDMYNE